MTNTMDTNKNEMNNFDFFDMHTNLDDECVALFLYYSSATTVTMCIN